MHRPLRRPARTSRNSRGGKPGSGQTTPAIVSAVSPGAKPNSVEQRLHRAARRPAASMKARRPSRLRTISREQRVEPVLAAALQDRGEGLGQLRLPARRARSACRGAPRRTAPPPSAGRASRNAPATLASSGNWCSTDSQKAWMVWIFSPPGVSSASANSLRARRSFSRVGLPAFERLDRLSPAPRRRASSSPTGSENTRFDMLAAAARV